MESLTEIQMQKTTAIHPRTRLGPVELTVASLDRQVAFYRDLLGLRLHQHEPGRAELGAGGETLLRLIELPAARRVHGTTGLYHFAVLVPSRPELARLIARLIRQGHPNYPTDHLMTETTYLDDLEGNGIEVYTDTPEDGTFSFAGGRFEARDAQGNLRSGRDPLDLDELFRHLSPSDDLNEPLPAGTVIGHVHLHVADLTEAVRFYHDGLGFDTMGLAPAFQAAFLSAGGYHHHVGVNTWLGQGAPPPHAGGLGLRHFTVIVPDQAEVDRLRERLSLQGAETAAQDGGFLSHDPSGNGVLAVAQGA